MKTRNARELFNLKGKVAIVTGGRGMYGVAISEGLAEMGAQVIIASRNLHGCEKTAKMIQDSGLSAEGCALELSNDESIDTLIDYVVKKYGKIDILVNNAMDHTNLVALEDAEREKLQASSAVNLDGHIMITKKALPFMRAQGGGSIIIMSSIRGLDAPHFPFYPVGYGGNLNYNTEKWALIGFTKWMAARYGKDNIRTNCICPGGHDPELSSDPFMAPFVKTYEEHNPLHRWADDYDMKGPVCFLASDASAYVNGAALVVDGGWTVW